MQHIVTIKNRRATDIQALTGDLDGHRIVQNGSNVDTVTFKFDSEWAGFPAYSVIFSREDGSVPDAEYALDYENPTLNVPSAMLTTSGKLRFGVKALDANSVTRLITEERNAYFSVVASGAIDGSAGNEDSLTRLEQALEDVEGVPALVEETEQALEDIEDAIARAEAIADIDYEKAINKPQVNDITLIGNKDLDDLGVGTATNLDVLNLFSDWS